MSDCPRYVEGAAAAPGSEFPDALLLLDRDGIINIDHGYVHRAEDTEWVEGIFRLASQVAESRIGIIVCTNQAGIGRGYYTDAQFHSYTEWVHRQFEENGTPILRTYYCPHHLDAVVCMYAIDCACRKPKPGMLLAALRDFHVPPARCLMIGDKATDVAAADSAGIRSVCCDSGDLSNACQQVASWRSWLSANSGQVDDMASFRTAINVEGPQANG